MNDYSYRDIMRMQEEAKARVMEMQRRSRFLAEDFAGGEPNAEFGMRNAELQGQEEPRARAIRMPVELPERREARAESGERRAEMRQGPEAVGAAAVHPVAGRDARQNGTRESNGLSAALRNVFGDLSGEEAEKMFLLALCLLLHQENGDEGLLMAMMYLLT